MPYHGVLAHQDNTLVPESQSDLVHLLRADIVNLNDEDGGIFLEQALELVEVAGLVRLAPHIFLVMKAGCLRASLGYRGWFFWWLEVVMKQKIAFWRRAKKCVRVVARALWG